MRLLIVIGVVCMTMGEMPAGAQPQATDLPRGLSLTETDEGTALAVGDKTVYRLLLDRLRRRFRGFLSFDIATARCGDECPRYWIPLTPPAGFRASGDWSIVNADTKPQLAYKNDPLYTFSGRSFEPLLQNRTAPAYFSGYTAKPGLMLGGVPVGTIYWEPVRYDRTAPEVTVPAGVKVSWAKTAFLFSDGSNRKLYVAKSGAACQKACDGLTPLVAPMVAQALGDWRPARDDDSGTKVWTYRNKTVYYLSGDHQQDPGTNWRTLEAR
jgi:predicted lipoprotein with Yx(FWY)xxD motif